MYSTLDEVEYTYKKTKLNKRYQVNSSYNENIKEQQKYDIENIKKVLDNELTSKKDGYRRDGILFEKVLKIIYENEGYKTNHCERNKRWRS